MCGIVTMFKGSFWYPGTWKGKLVLVAVLVMIPLQQSELLGLMSSQYLVGGWLPLQLAYDFSYQLVGVVILYAMYRMAPSPPPEFEPTVTEQSSVTDAVTKEKRPAGDE